MSSFNPLSFAQIVDNEVAAVEASSSVLYNFNSGSTLNAILQANAGNSLWLQGLVAYLLSIARLATCTGINVDTFINDFGYTRTQPTAATGAVTFSRASPTTNAVIPASNVYPGSPVAAVVSSSTSQQLYFVTINTANIYWNATQNAYILPSGIGSYDFPVEAVTAGNVGNAQINQINTLYTSIAGIDTVSNAAALDNGTNLATDDETKTGFILYLASLFRATLQAIEYAIQIVPGVVRYNVVENETYPSGSPSSMPGFFYAIVDDGTGSPPGSLITNVTASIENYRGLTIAYSVYEPSVTNVTIAVTVEVPSTYSSMIVTANIKNALVTYINELDIGDTLFYTRLVQIMYDSDPNIIDISGYTLNSGTSDLAGTNTGVFLTNSGAIAVTVVNL